MMKEPKTENAQREGKDGEEQKIYRIIGIDRSMMSATIKAEEIIVAY